MDNKPVAVIWNKDGQARIFHGVDAKALAGVPNVLINPIMPSGVPPHLWELKNGAIAIKSAPEANPSTHPHLTIRHSPLWHYLLTLAAGAVLALLLKGIL